MAGKEARHTPLGLQEPFAQLVQGVLDYAIFLLDTTGHIVTANRGVESTYGYRAGELIGKHLSVFYPPDAIARRWPEHELRQAEATGRLEDENWRLRKDGSRFWANVIITAMRDEGGRLYGYSKITRDLTERRAQEEALRQSEERFRLLVEAVKDYAIVMLDREGRVASWNSGASRIMGYEGEEILGRHFAAFSPPEAVAKKWPEQELAMAREHGRYEDEGLRVRKDGAAFWAHAAVTPVYDRQGVLIGYALVIRDLADRRRVEALEKAERQTNEFIAMLAHELRNPLAPISNALQLLARRPTGERTDPWVLEVLQRQTAQLQRLVDDLLDVGRITRSAIRLERKPLDVRGVVRVALEASMQWIQARRQALSVSMAEEAMTVLGDEARLTQIVQNLLHNATRHTPEGGRIEVSVALEEGAVRIGVKDAGVGMDAETLQLTLVQRLVQMHGGSVEARNAGPQQGSELIVRLPLIQAPEMPREQAAPAPRPPARRVLIVDDNQDAATALKLLLEGEGHEVKVANDGVSGLELARSYRPDYLLLDIGLPRLSGYDIAATLRADPALRKTTIVAVTGYGQVHDRARTAAVGFDHHLTKPVEFSALQALFGGKPL